MRAIVEWLLMVNEVDRELAFSSFERYGKESCMSRRFHHNPLWRDGFDSGRVETAVKITSKDLRGDVHSDHYGMSGRFFGEIQADPTGAT